MKAWKMAEKEIAEYFGGIRRSRVSYSEVAGDVIHPTYSIEVKYGKQIPDKAIWGKRCKFLDNAFKQARKYDPNKYPIVALKKPGMRGFVYVIDTGEFYLAQRVNPTSPRLPLGFPHLPVGQIECSDHPTSAQTESLNQHLRAYT